MPEFADQSNADDSLIWKQPSGIYPGWAFATVGGWWVLRTRSLPLAPWDVYREYRVGEQYRFNRQAGGFYTRRSAKKWAEHEHQRG